jgi:hypothetical protein
MTGDEVCGVVRWDEVFSLVLSTLARSRTVREEVLDYRWQNRLCLVG